MQHLHTGISSQPFVHKANEVYNKKRGRYTCDTQSVIQSEAKDLENIHVYTYHCVTEILPPFGRLTSC